MGGIIVKICLIEDFVLKIVCIFEVVCIYCFVKGFGMLILILVIEMIEIGVGGGFIVWVDVMGWIQIGLEFVVLELGFVCYQCGGDCLVIIDVDLVLGKLDFDNFVGGVIKLLVLNVKVVIDCDVGVKLCIFVEFVVFGIVEVVDENMVNVVCVYVVENGKSILDNMMIVFGGVVLLYVVWLCEKLGIDCCFVLLGVGVGLVIGFLCVFFGYEVLVLCVIWLLGFDLVEVNVLLDGLKIMVEGFVCVGISGMILCEIIVYMCYVGQGWEIFVMLFDCVFVSDDIVLLCDSFCENYVCFFGCVIDGLDGLEIEVVIFLVKVQDGWFVFECVVLIFGIVIIVFDMYCLVFDLV